MIRYVHTDQTGDRIHISEADDAGYAYVEIKSTGGNYSLVYVPIDERRAAAQAMAGDLYEVIPVPAVPADIDDIEVAQRDLRRIMAELGMSLHARTESSHDVVLREVLPRIREVMAAQPDRPEPIDIEQVKRNIENAISGPAGEVSDREFRAVMAVVYSIVERIQAADRPEPIDPADVKIGMVVEVSHDGPPPWRLEGTVIDRPSSGLRLFRDLWISFKPGGELLTPTDATVRLVSRVEPEPDPQAVEALDVALASVGLYAPHDAALRLIRDHKVRVGEQP